MCKTVFVYSGLYTGSQHAPCWSDTLPRALACPNLSFKPIILAPKNAPPGTDEGDPLPAYPIEVQLNVLPSNLLSSLTLLSSPPALYASQIPSEEPTNHVHTPSCNLALIQTYHSILVSTSAPNMHHAGPTHFLVPLLALISHSNLSFWLPKMRLQGRAGGNRYPTVTQLPPGTSPSKIVQKDTLHCT